MAPTEWDPLLPNSEHQTGRNYTGILTKTIVYGITLVLFLIGACFSSSFGEFGCLAATSYHIAKRFADQQNDFDSLRIHAFIDYSAELGQLQ